VPGLFFVPEKWAEEVGRSLSLFFHGSLGNPTMLKADRM
jgi:hypothetical protein